MADVSKAGAGILTDLAFNAVVDWLSPVEYDGSALMSLPPTDPRLQPSALLAWEVRNYLGWINELLVPLRKNLASTSARDKLVRFVQYALTVILGAMAMSPRHERQHWLFQALRKLRFTISTARRTFRFLEFGPILSLVDCSRIVRDGEPYWPARIISITSVFAFSLLDRLRWLQEHNLCHGNALKTAVRAMRFICISNAASVLRQLLRVCTATAASQGEARLWLRDALKQMLCLLQAAHIGQVPYLQTHDVLVGLAGMATTGDDLLAIWRRSRE